MNPTLALAWAQVKLTLREKETLFWFVLFPLLLLSLLNLVFGRLGQEGAMNFTVAFLNEDQAGPEGMGTLIEQMFAALAVPSEEGKEPLFTLRKPHGEANAEFLAQAQEAARLGRIHAVVRIPPDFTARLQSALAGSSPSGPVVWVEVYYRKGDAAASMAAGIVEQVLKGANWALSAHWGMYRQELEVPFSIAWAGGGRASVRYADYILPGLVLMGFFVGGLFGVPGSILFARDYKILRRYWVTPVRVPQYLGGFVLSYAVLCTVQAVLLVGVGRWGFGAQVNFLRPAALGYLVLAASTSLSFGFLVATLAKTAQAGMALANILNMPMMFLSSLFFPVADLPWALQVIVSLNPLSYLADGLRSALGLGQPVYPVLAGVLVPLAWCAAGVGISAWRFRWDVER